MLPFTSGVSGKSLGGFWAVSKAGTMASVRTSVKQSENSLDSGERFALF